MMKTGIGQKPAFAQRDSSGLTMREYFAAQAPHEPQPWFKPRLPEKPILPSPYSELSSEERDLWEADEIDRTNLKLVEFNDRYRAAKKNLDEWELLAEKERYTQWPAAWSDAVIEELYNPFKA